MFDQEVLRDDLAQPGASVDRPAKVVNMVAHGCRERAHVLVSRDGFEVVFVQLAISGDEADGAEGHSAENDGSLGEGVCLFARVIGNPIEQFVQFDERSTLDVPMRVLGLHGQIDGAGERAVQHLDQLVAVVVGNVLRRWLRPHCGPRIFAGAKIVPSTVSSGRSHPTSEESSGFFGA